MIDKKEYIAQKRGLIVTEEGDFLGVKGEKVGIINNEGYITSKIRINKKTKHIAAHRLQAFQKYGERLYDNGIIVRHLDGNKLNNSHSNITIGTNSENSLDIPEQIRIQRARYATSKRKVIHNSEEIKKYYIECKSYDKTMKEFNISSKGTLHFILNKR